MRGIEKPYLIEIYVVLFLFYVTVNIFYSKLSYIISCDQENVRLVLFF